MIHDLETTREAALCGLPAGHTIRPPTLEDAATVAELCRIVERRMGRPPATTTTLLQQVWTNPEMTLERDLRLVHDSDGALVGYFGVSRNGQGNHPYLFGHTHPDAEGRGIGTAALRWGERRTREFMERLPADQRVSVHASSQSDFAPRIALLEGFGMHALRSSRDMVIEIEGQTIPAPHWPDGIELRPFERERDALLLYRAIDESFSDHWGHEPEASEEEGFAHWSHWVFGSEFYDPALMVVAWAGDEIAAFSLSDTHAHADHEAGYLGQLGVRRPWRKRGLATALLHHTFALFQQRGQLRVSLDVDGENLTGATRLYERVGMRIRREFIIYEKELRSGRETALR